MPSVLLKRVVAPAAMAFTFRPCQPLSDVPKPHGSSFINVAGGIYCFCKFVSDSRFNIQDSGCLYSRQKVAHVNKERKHRYNSFILYCCTQGTCVYNILYTKQNTVQ